MSFWNFLVSCIAIPASSTAFAHLDTALVAPKPAASSASRPSHRARRLRRASRASRRVTP